MTAHLPECPGRGTEDADLPWHVDCICPALRACTARVIGEVRAAVLAYADLVDAVGGYSWDEAIAGSLAAIDRLTQDATTTCPVPLATDATEPRNLPGWHSDTTQDSDRSETRTQEAE